MTPDLPFTGSATADIERVDLLIVGGMALDRFADGSVRPGGTVIHAARALALDGRRLSVVTVAGDEPAAVEGLRLLSELGSAHVERARQTVSFEHREQPDGRVLRLAAPADPLTCPPRDVRPAAVLYAPLAGELGPDLGGQHYPGARTGAILQGWLRTLEPGRRVEPLPLASLDATLRDALAGCELLAASVEDLAAEGGGPPAKLYGLRRLFGPDPLLVVTAGEDGAWLAMPGGSIHHVRPPRVVSGPSTVGSGDAFVAVLLAALARGVAPIPAAEDAASLVSELLAERTGRTVHVVGDVHGMRDELRRLLRNAGLIDEGDAWIGGRDELWCAGDLVDRGPDGIGVVQLLMGLEVEAAAAGGRVGSVLGNHEILLLAAREMPDASSGGQAGTMRGDWLANGGQLTDLGRLSEAQAGWLRALPGLARIGPALLMHADASLYAHLGPSVPEVNATVCDTLKERRVGAWDALLAGLSERRAFVGDERLVVGMLGRFGGRLIVHGHTPIPSLTHHRAPATEAYIYADGRCVAVDGALCRGGPGFVYRVPHADAGPIMRG